MSKFDPPKPQALTPNELVQSIAKFGANAAGVANAVELIQIQDQLKAQDEHDLKMWAKQMAEDGSPKALAALEKAGFNVDGVYQGGDLGTGETPEAAPETESRVDNRKVILATGLEGQFDYGSGSERQITHKGSRLAAPAAALETATADIVSFFKPQTRLFDELGPLTTILSVAALFGLSSSGSDGQLGQILGLLGGLLLATGLTLPAKLFPGIFALTSFGVNGARLLRGILTGVMSLTLLTMVAVEVRPATTDFPGLPLSTYEILVAVLLILATAFGLLSSGPKTTWLRLGIFLIAPLAIVSFAFSMSTGYGLPELALDVNDVWFGLALGLLLKGSVDFSSTSGGWRYQWLSISIAVIGFTTTTFLVFVSYSLHWMVFLALVSIAVMANFAAAVSSAARFWSVIGGFTAGIALTCTLIAFGVPSPSLVVFAAALTGAWLASIAFDSRIRKGRLHLASLNRSFGFYGPFNWLSVLVLFSSGLIGGSLALFSPLTDIVPAIASAPVLGIIFASMFALVRIPQIKSQEDEIMLAMSRSSAANQVGIT